MLLTETANIRNFRFCSFINLNSLDINFFKRELFNIFKATLDKLVNINNK